jgi:hypothetical protein
MLTGPELEGKVRPGAAPGETPTASLQLQIQPTIVLGPEDEALTAMNKLVAHTHNREADVGPLSNL